VIGSPSFGIDGAHKIIAKHDGIAPAVKIGEAAFDHVIADGGDRQFILRNNAGQRDALVAPGIADDRLHPQRNRHRPVDDGRAHALVTATGLRMPRGSSGGQAFDLHIVEDILRRLAHGRRGARRKSAHWEWR
jgi:hypothetical protein